LSAKYVEFSDNDNKYTATLAVYDPNVVPEVSAGSVPARSTDLKEGEIVVPESYTETLGVSKEDLVGKEMKVTIVKPSESLSQEEIVKLLASGDMSAITNALGGEEETLTFKIAAVAGENQMSFTSGEAATQISAADAEKIYDYTTEGTDNYEKYFGANAVVKDGTEPADAKQKLENDGYAVQTTKDLQALIFTIVNVLQWIVAGFGILALIASVFGIINTMYISVLERTNQIGLMRALGAPAKSIAKLFRYEAAWIGLLGGVIGILLALVTVLLLNPWINTALDLGEGNYLLEFAWWQAGLLLLGLIVVAIAAGWWPARKAAKLDPIEALRTE
jgi:putative ABC transport system permease protein